MKIKDCYCVTYFGNANQFLIQLKLVRPFIEKAFPGVEMYLACKDECLYLLEGEQRIVPKSRFKKEDFNYVRSLNSGLDIHPVEHLLQESGIQIGPIVVPSPPEQGIRVCPKGTFPHKTLTESQVEELSQFTDGVVGVENEETIQAAVAGFKVVLADGPGSQMFLTMFPNGEIYKFRHT